MAAFLGGTFGLGKVFAAAFRGGTSGLGFPHFFASIYFEPQKQWELLQGLTFGSVRFVLCICQW